MLSCNACVHCDSARPHSLQNGRSCITLRGRSFNCVLCRVHCMLSLFCVFPVPCCALAAAHAASPRAAAAATPKAAATTERVREPAVPAGLVVLARAGVCQLEITVCLPVEGAWRGVGWRRVEEGACKGAEQQRGRDYGSRCNTCGASQARRLPSQDAQHPLRLSISRQHSTRAPQYGSSTPAHQQHHSSTASTSTHQWKLPPGSRCRPWME
mgnify:CR=1 FL=1